MTFDVAEVLSNDTTNHRHHHDRRLHMTLDVAEVWSNDTTNHRHHHDHHLDMTLDVAEVLSNDTNNHTDAQVTNKSSMGVGGHQEGSRNKSSTHGPSKVMGQGADRRSSDWGTGCGVRGTGGVPSPRPAVLSRFSPILVMRHVYLTCCTYYAIWRVAMLTKYLQLPCLIKADHFSSL